MVLINPLSGSIDQVDLVLIGHPVLDKGTSVITFTATTTTTAAATAAMFPNADDNLSNCVENPSLYN